MNKPDTTTTGNHTIVKNRFKIHGKRLKIDDYRPSLDSGVYVCVATNSSNTRHHISNASIFLGDTGRLTIKISRLPLSIIDEEYGVDYSSSSSNGRIIELSCQVTPTNSGNILYNGILFKSSDLNNLIVT